jgi:hypothetical protein
MPRRPKKPEPFPATGDATDAPHVQRAERGCPCLSCGVHRLLDRRARRDHALVRESEREPMTGAVEVGVNASAALREAFNYNRWRGR